MKSLICTVFSMVNVATLAHVIIFRIYVIETKLDSVSAGDKTLQRRRKFVGECVLISPKKLLYWSGSMSE